MSSLLTIKQMAEIEPSFTESSLRWIVFRAAEVSGKKREIKTDPKLTKFAPAIHRIGGRVKIDRDKFIAIAKGEV